MYYESDFFNFMTNTFSSKTQKEAEDLLKKVKKSTEMKRIQCILFRCLGSNSVIIGRSVGYQPSHVRLVWQWYCKEGWGRLLGERRGKNRGKAHWNIEEELQFLKPFMERAKKGELVIIKEIHREHQRLLGIDIHKTVTYRLLHRHEWRKITPRPEHPKHNLEDIKRFKEAIFPPSYDPYENYVYSQEKTDSSTLSG